MFFRQLQAEHSSLSYLFGCGSLGKAVAVDVVAGDEQWFIDEAKKQNVAITHVIDTHIHADHYSGSPKLAKQINAQYCLHEYNQTRVKHAFTPLKHGNTIEAGNTVVKVLHTPGHTMDSICLLVTDKRRGEDPWFVLTGDTLFVGSIGRPDLAGKEKEMAGMLFDSLQKHILTLSNEVEIFPGHQAGSVCGAGISGKPSSTIGFEKRFNRGLQIQDKLAFVKFLTTDIPVRPTDMDEMVKSNLGA